MDRPMPAPLAPLRASTEPDWCTTPEDDSPVKWGACSLQPRSEGKGSLQPPVPSPSIAHPQLDALPVVLAPPVAVGLLAALPELDTPMPAPSTRYLTPTESDGCATTEDDSPTEPLWARAHLFRFQDCDEGCRCMRGCFMGEFCCCGLRSCDRDGRQHHSMHYCRMCDPDL